MQSQILFKNLFFGDTDKDILKYVNVSDNIYEIANVIYIYLVIWLYRHVIYI